MELTSVPLDKLKSQLAQIDALIAEGVLKGDAALAARDDLERQILAAVLAGSSADGAAPAAAAAPTTAPDATAPVPTSPAPFVPVPPPLRPPRRLVAGVVVFVLAFGGLGYGLLGNREGWSVSPGSPGAPAENADAAAHSTESAQIEAMISRLAERLKTQPDDAEGWSMLARTYTSQGRYADALPAFKKAFELRPKDAQAMADYADGLAVANNRTLDGEPEKLVMQAVKLDPANVKALSLAGTIAFNRADFPGAIGYWERALKVSDPAGDFSRQLQGALNEARQRAGLPTEPAPPGLFAAESAAAPATPPPAAPGATEAAVSGRVSLKEGLKGKVAADDTVFIFARAPSGSRMPLAILRKKVSDLPLDFTLDDSLSMSPAARLSSAQQVVVGARVSKSGTAAPQPGDWQALSAPVALGAKDLRIEIGEPVR
jgi:cytochrome c-type biogenesis protein CcmH